MGGGQTITKTTSTTIRQSTMMWWNSNPIARISIHFDIIDPLLEHIVIEDGSVLHEFPLSLLIRWSNPGLLSPSRVGCPFPQSLHIVTSSISLNEVRSNWSSFSTNIRYTKILSLRIGVALASQHYAKNPLFLRWSMLKLNISAFCSETHWWESNSGFCYESIPLILLIPNLTKKAATSF